MKAGCLRQAAAPDSWPWPMSEDARRWIVHADGFQFCGMCHQGMDCGIKRICNYQSAANAHAEFFNKSNSLGHAPDAKPAHPIEEHARQFDSEKHREFMRGLG